MIGRETLTHHQIGVSCAEERLVRDIIAMVAAMTDAGRWRAAGEFSLRLQPGLRGPIIPGAGTPTSAMMPPQATALLPGQFPGAVGCAPTANPAVLAAVDLGWSIAELYAAVKPDHLQPPEAPERPLPRIAPSRESRRIQLQQDLPGSRVAAGTPGIPVTGRVRGGRIPQASPADEGGWPGYLAASGLASPVVPPHLARGTL